MNIPIYRSKKIDSDEYVVGNLNKVNDNLYINGFTGDLDDTDYGYGFDEIDTTTVAIHFPDMLDSENNPIFASLSKSGKGGDIMESEKFKNNMALNGVVKYDKGRISIDTSGFMPKFEKLKIIGIQE